MRDPYKQLDEEINMGEEARQEAREFMRIYWLYGVIAPVVVLAVLWLGGAF